MGGILWSSILTDEDQLLKKGAMKFVTAPEFKYKLIKEDGTVEGSPEKIEKQKKLVFCTFLTNLLYLESQILEFRSRTHSRGSLFFIPKPKFFYI